MSSVNFLYCTFDAPGASTLMESLRRCQTEVYDHECDSSGPLLADLYVVTITKGNVRELEGLRAWFPGAVFVRDKSIPARARVSSPVPLRWGRDNTKIRRVVFSRMLQIARSRALQLVA